MSYIVLNMIVDGAGIASVRKTRPRRRRRRRQLSVKEVGAGIGGVSSLVKRRKLRRHPLAPSPHELSLSATLSRRKLFDRAMSVFLVGNTHARQLYTEQEAKELAIATTTATPLSFLYMGVGDPRNPLASLVQIPLHRPVWFHLNDFSAVVVSRAIVLLAMAAAGGEDGAEEASLAATDVWSDARLSRSSAASLHVSSEAVCRVPLVFLALPPHPAPHPFTAR